MQARGIRLITALIATLGLCAEAHASSVSGGYLIGVGFSFSSSPVFRIDPSTGAGMEIGLSGVGTLNSATLGPSGEVLSAVNGFAGELLDGFLVSIDPDTAFVTPFVELDLGDAVADVRGLQFVGDTLFLLNNEPIDPGSPMVGDPDFLYTVDPISGTGTLVGDTSFGSLQGLTSSLGGDLFAWDVELGLVTIDLLTGLATDVNGLEDGTPFIQGISFIPDGTLLGARDELFQIDPVTGELTSVGADSYSNIRGLAFIPEPSTWMLLLLGMGALSLVARRSKSAELPARLRRHPPRGR